MSSKIYSAKEAPVASKIAPVKRPAVAVAKYGCLKVRLEYLTETPTHERSLVMQADFNAHPPFIEDVCILLPCAKAFNNLSTYQKAFQRLQASGVLPKSAVLKDFYFLEEDLQTISYVI